VTIQWHFQNVRDVGILRISGYLGDAAAPRFGGAVRWALARCEGPLVLDLTSLTGWSDDGREAVRTAVELFTAEGRPLEFAAAPEGADGLGATASHADITTALRAHRIPAADRDAAPEWHTTGWSAPPRS
jgi:hypothetical protein